MMEYSSRQRFSVRLISIAAILFGLVSMIAAHPAFAIVQPDLVDLVKRLKPVVVNISTTQVQEAVNHKGMVNPFQGSPLEKFFEQFQQRMPQHRQESRSLGSGVIIDPAGFILTNNHVVGEADRITVRLADEREFEARIVGRDEKTDLALIRIKTEENLPVAKLGASDQAEVGSWVVAIGNPFGLDATVTAGIISAKGRVIGSGPYDNFIQTDAAINPGNSGGPLFNMQGKVIGINTAIFSRSGGNMGIGFAIPINLAKSIIPQLKTEGRVTRGWLGVRIQVISQQLAEALGLERKIGALVASVESGSPADAGGLKTGDVIVRFDGNPVERMRDLPALVAATPVGKTVQVDVVRDGANKRLPVRIAELRDDAAKPVTRKPGKTSWFGLDLRSLTPELRQRLEIPEEMAGVVVAGVEEGGRGQRAGLRQGDLIREVNRQPVKNLDDMGIRLPQA